MMDIGTHVRGVCTPIGQGLEGGEGRNAKVMLSGSTAISCDDGALRDSRSAGPMFSDGCPLLCGRLCVHRGCGRVRSGTPYGPW
jgi:hypothetical protein